MAWSPRNANGSATSANSEPVVIASDQAAVATKAAAAAFADGWDVNSGATTDAVVAAGASGSISAKLRRLTTDLAAASAKLPAALGQLTKAASMSVTVASDQTVVVAPKHKGYGTIATIMTTAMNALANVTVSAASTTVDNTTNLDLKADLELSLIATSAKSAGANVLVFMIRAMDGTNFDGIDIASAELVAVFPFAATTTARQSSRPILLPPGLSAFFVYGQMGVAFGASGNTLKIRPY